MKIKKFGYRFLLFEMSFENQNQYFLDLRFSRDLLTNLPGPELLSELKAHFFIFFLIGIHPMQG